MSREEIYELAEQANNICEEKNKPFRFWIAGNSYFICNNIEDGDDIDELSEEHFINRAKKIVGLAQ
jgi:hypothetical protein